jgi:hypothetical protein
VPNALRASKHNRHVQHMRPSLKSKIERTSRPVNSVSTTAKAVRFVFAIQGVAISYSSTRSVEGTSMCRSFRTVRSGARVTATTPTTTAVTAAIIETVNSVLATRLRSWALGRITIGDVDRSVQKTLDLIFGQGQPQRPR